MAASSLVGATFNASFNAYFRRNGAPQSGTKVIQHNMSRPTTVATETRHVLVPGWQTREPAQAEPQDVKRRARGVAEAPGMQACAACRSAKRRCDGARPCTACVRRGCADGCVDWDRTRALIQKCSSNRKSCAISEVERPMTWRTFGVRFSAGGAGSEQTQPVPDLRTLPSVEIVSSLLNHPFFGTDTERLARLLSSMPLNLIEAIASCVRSAGQKLDFCSRIAKPQNLRSVQSRNCYSGIAYIGHRFLPDGTTEVSINEAYSKVFHAHPEEVLARLGRRQLPSVFSDFDVLCVLLNSLDWTLCGCNGQQETMQWFGPVGRGPSYTDTAEPALVRTEVRVTYDANGQPATVENWLVPLTVEEFDLAMELSPAFCRPFARLTGDLRRGAALRRGYGAEHAVSMAEAAQAEERRRLQVLGQVVQQRVAYAERLFAQAGRYPAYPFMSNPLIGPDLADVVLAPPQARAAQDLGCPGVDGGVREAEACRRLDPGREVAGTDEESSAAGVQAGGAAAADQAQSDGESAAGQGRPSGEQEDEGRSTEDETVTFEEDEEEGSGGALLWELGFAHELGLWADDAADACSSACWAGDSLESVVLEPASPLSVLLNSSEA